MKLLKFISFAMFALMLAAGCSGVGGDDEPAEPEGDGSGLVATVSPSNIVANGVDTAVIDVRYGGAAVDFKDVKFYNSDDNSLLNWSSYNYTTTTAGTVTFYVTYKTHSTKDKPLTITAIEDEVDPQLPDDPDADNLSFVHRSLLIDFTGAWCGNCPYVIAAIREIEADEEYSNKVVIAASHYGDKMAISGNPLENMCGIKSWPSLNLDFTQAVPCNNGFTAAVKAIQTFVNRRQDEKAKAGIAVSVTNYGSKVSVLTSVKAGETKKYCIGAWLLEDGITEEQENFAAAELGTDFNTHQHVIRILDSRAGNSSSYIGNELGEIKSGEYAEKLFTWELNNSWKRDNCSIIVFVSTQKDNGAWYVTNAVHIDSLSGEYPFEYVEE